MAYGVIMCYHLHMPLYILGTFAEYPQYKTESRYKDKLTTKSCFRLHKILDSIINNKCFRF